MPCSGRGPINSNSNSCSCGTPFLAIIFLVPKDALGGVCIEPPQRGVISKI